MCVGDVCGSGGANYYVVTKTCNENKPKQKIQNENAGGLNAGSVVCAGINRRRFCVTKLRRSYFWVKKRKKNAK